MGGSSLKIYIKVCEKAVFYCLSTCRGLRSENMSAEKVFQIFHDVQGVFMTVQGIFMTVQGVLITVQGVFMMVHFVFMTVQGVFMIGVYS